MVEKHMLTDRTTNGGGEGQKLAVGRGDRGHTLIACYCKPFHACKQGQTASSADWAALVLMLTD